MLLEADIQDLAINILLHLTILLRNVDLYEEEMYVYMSQK